MRNLKKGAVLFLVLALVFAMTACTSGGSGGSGSKKDVTLQLWHIHTNDTRKIPIEEGVKRFEAANPGIKVEITILENDPYKTKLRTVMGSGDAPDIFHSWGGGWLKAFVNEGLVVDITKEIADWKGELNEAAVGMNTFDGKVWGSPIINSSTPFYYNKEMFAKYNLTPPETFDDLIKICDTLKSNGIIPFAEANLTKWPGAQHFVYLSMRLGGPDIFQKAIDGQVRFDDPVFIKAGEMLQDMLDKGYFPDGVNALNWDTGDSRQMFYAEKAGMIVQTSGFIAACKGENEDFFNNKLGVSTYPSIAGGLGKNTDVLAGENAFSISSNCKNVEDAVKLLKFLSTDQKVQQDLADNGTIGAKTGLNAPTPVLQEAMKQISEATYLQNFIDQTLSPELGEKHKDTCQALFGKTMTPEQAAAEMQKLYESITK